MKIYNESITRLTEHELMKHSEWWLVLTNAVEVFFEYIKETMAQTQGFQQASSVYPATCYLSQQPVMSRRDTEWTQIRHQVPTVCLGKGWQCECQAVLHKGECSPGLERPGPWGRRFSPRIKTSP